MPKQLTKSIYQKVLLLYKILLSQSRQRKSIAFKANICKQITSAYSVRSIHTRLKNERNLYFQFLTTWIQANTFKKSRRTFPMFWWEKTVLTKFKNTQWRKYFRMSRKIFMNLVNTLKPKLKCSDVTQNMTDEKKVGLTLFFLASGKSRTVLCKLFNIKIDEVTTCIKQVCKAILETLFVQYIKVPDEIKIISYLQDFETKWGIPHCAGVLDCLHVPLDRKKLPENSRDYLNSDGGYSMYLQGVVDPSYKFWDVNVGWPGSVTESKVLTSSTLWKKGQGMKLFPDWTRTIYDMDVPIFILGSSSYPLTNWILKPVQPSDNNDMFENHLKFNQKFTFARSISEIAFKRLKARWNCLVSRSICNIDEYPTIVTACCVLHNVCETVKEPVEDEWIVRSEKLYRQPLPFSCNTIGGSNAENIQCVLNRYFTEQNE